MARRKNQIIDTQVPGQIAGRFHTSKYFASNQSLVFIGPYLLDEALAVNYKLEQRKVPIYGYASQYFDAVAAGKVIVTGTLTINYIDSGYLYLAMMEATTFGAQNSASDVVKYAIKSSNSLGNKIADTLGKISSDGPFAKTPIQTTMMRDIAQMIATDPIAGQQIIKQLRNKYWKFSDKSKREFTSNVTVSQLQDQFVGKSDLADPDQFMDHTLFARPDQMPPINITVSHGNPFQRESNTYRVIREAHILSVEQHIGPTGQPQAETYTFIARSIV